MYSDAEVIRAVCDSFEQHSKALQTRESYEPVISGLEFACLR